jgi:hypothetical protein
MVDVLKRIAGLGGVDIPQKPPSESCLSWTFRHVTEQIPWESELFDYRREFIMACICRAYREPNLAHLVAAHLCAAHIIGDIGTTNFDDLAPAAFWGLPFSTAYRGGRLRRDSVSASISGASAVSCCGVPLSGRHAGRA